MKLSETIGRLLTGRTRPTTEQVQRQILTFIDGNGVVEATQLYARLNITRGGYREPTSTDKGMIDEAAQILVNKRMLRATRDRRPVDPVTAGGVYLLAYPIEKDALP
ncbi:MAG: hypothetical protein P1V34_04960 [Alphaproteobacteria bacterium]|nr:hypothetical protein [Alphaproteobacteria bacterium]